MAEGLIETYTDYLQRAAQTHVERGFLVTAEDYREAARRIETLTAALVELCGENDFMPDHIAELIHTQGGSA